MRKKIFTTVDVNKKYSLMSIHARVWRDNENGNPYFAYVITLNDDERAGTVHVVRSMDYGSMNSDNIRNAALMCIKQQFPFVSIGHYNYYYKKARYKELEHPENWLDIATGTEIKYVKSSVAYIV